MDNRLAMSQLCAPGIKKANGILGHIKKHVVSSLGEVILCLFSAMVRIHLENCVFNKNREFLKSSLLKFTKYNIMWESEQPFLDFTDKIYLYSTQTL